MTPTLHLLSPPSSLLRPGWSGGSGVWQHDTAPLRVARLLTDAGREFFAQVDGRWVGSAATLSAAMVAAERSWCNATVRVLPSG